MYNNNNTYARDWLIEKECGRIREMGPNAAAEKQSEQLRIDGNNYFNKGRFGAAIDAYTEVYSSSSVTVNEICFFLKCSSFN